MSTTGSDPEVSKNVLSDEPRRPVSPDTPSSEKRFQFGKNWAKFLELLDDDRMRMARESLRSMLGLENLKGMSFLDAGSGSGVFSLAAIQLDADSVYSFDYDEHSVGCTRYLRERYGSKRCDWTIGRGDVWTRDSSTNCRNSTSFIHGECYIIRATCGPRWTTFALV